MDALCCSLWVPVGSVSLSSCRLGCHGWKRRTRGAGGITEGDVDTLQEDAPCPETIHTTVWESSASTSG